MGIALTQDDARFISDIEKESDRGLALVISAHLEDTLEVLLRAYFSKCGKATKAELDSLLTNALAPIGTFAIRTKLAFALGLIDGREKKALDLIRNVRNRFVHRVEEAVWPVATIDDMFNCYGPALGTIFNVLRLLGVDCGFPEKLNEATPRDKFVLTAVIAIGMIRGAISKLESVASASAPAATASASGET